MNYIVVTQEWMAARGLMPLPDMRKSKDGNKIILHEDYFNLVAKRDEEGNLILDGADVYPHNSQELDDLLASEEWACPEEEAPTESAAFIQVAAVRNLMQATRAGIQEMDLADSEALKVKDMYPEWAEFINQPLSQGMKVQDGGKLWKARKDINPVLEIYPPGSKGSESLYEEISESHAGTLEDPIPYNNNMELLEGKHYAQGGIVYLCTRSTGQPVYDDLSALVGIYVQQAGKEGAA